LSDLWGSAQLEIIFFFKNIQGVKGLSTLCTKHNV
ncbi:mCG1026224, partial [Mus musculus]